MAWHVRAYKGVLRMDPYVGCRGRDPGQRGQKAKPSEAENFLAFACQKEGNGKLASLVFYKLS